MKNSLLANPGAFASVLINVHHKLKKNPELLLRDGLQMQHIFC